MAARITQEIGEVMYGSPGVDVKARVTQVIGEVMFKPTASIDVSAMRVVVVSSTRSTKTVLNNPVMM